MVKKKLFKLKVQVSDLADFSGAISGVRLKNLGPKVELKTITKSGKGKREWHKNRES